MKIIKKLVFVAIIIIIFSCSKKEETPTPVSYQEENFLDNYLAATGFNQTTANVVDGADNELGTEFVPLVKGKITSITFKLPAVNNGIRFTVWKKATAFPFFSFVRNTSTPANTLVTIPISAVNSPNLDKDTEYAITMNTNDWYNRKKTDGTAVTYPITVGNIKILSYKYKSGTSQSYPDTQNNTVYSGDLSFTFLRTE